MRKPTRLIEPLESRTLLSATHLRIIPTFARTITRDSHAPAIEASINAAIKVLENAFSNPITIRITFEKGPGLGSSSSSFDTISYTRFRAALASHKSGPNDASALATLPAKTNPLVPGALIDITTANEKALGLNPGSASDGTITLSTNECNLNRASINPDKYDLQSIAMHEMDEILGIGSDLDGFNNGDPPPTYSISPEDLFRYTKSGQRSFTTNINAHAYFSIDGGATDLAQFNQESDGDFGDWFSANGDQIPQVQDAFGTPGIVINPNVELTVLDVLGYAASHTLGTSIISGQIFNDVNANTIQDTGDHNLSGWIVEALQNGKVITTAISDSTGYQLTALPPGTYTIKELVPVGYHKTTPAAPYTVTITGPNQTITGQTFGNTRIA